MTKVINVVGAAILNENYQVLTTKRNDNRVLSTLWEFPGGKIESGERAQDALKRELQEEFNDQIEVGHLAAPVSVHQYDFGEIHLAVYYAKMDTHNFELVAHSKVKWGLQAELMQLHWAAADLPIATHSSQANLR